MFEETFIMEEQFEEEVFERLNFDFVLNMINANEQEFLFQITEEEPINRKNIIENLIPDNTFVSPLMIERENRTLIDDRRISAEQAIISNNYHNIFELNTTLINTSQVYFQQTSETMNQFQFNFEIISSLFNQHLQLYHRTLYLPF
jgi:hypothetical protein